jgi:hypothetical protein
VESKPVEAPLPSIPLAPAAPVEKEKEKERREERPLGPFFPVVVKVPILEPEEKIEPEFRIGTPKPRIEIEEHRREIEHFQPLIAPLRFEKVEKRLEEWLEPLTFTAPAVAEEQARRQARAVTPIQLMETPRPSPPSAPSPPAPSSLEWKVRLPGLPYFSPPPASVVYRAPEWRIGKYWRVDWFAEGLKLDVGFGQISRLLAAQMKAKATEKAKVSERKEPKMPKLEAEKAGERKGAKRRAKARQVDWFKGGLLGEKRARKTTKTKRRGKKKVRAK